MKFFWRRKKKNNKLTVKQIAEWRRILVGEIGVHALILPEEKIYKIHKENPGVVE